LIKNTKNTFFKRNFIIFIIYIIFFIIQLYVVFPIEKIFTSKLSLYFPSLIFIPHGIRVLACLIYGKEIFLGLFLGHVVCYIFVTSNINEIFLGALGSTLSAYVALYIIYKKLDVNFNIINLKNIIYLSIVSAFINAFLSSLIKYNQFSIDFLLQYFIGDFIGVFILLLLINHNKKIILKLLIKND